MEVMSKNKIFTDTVARDKSFFQKLGIGEWASPSANLLASAGTAMSAIGGRDLDNCMSDLSA